MLLYLDTIRFQGCQYFLLLRSFYLCCSLYLGWFVGSIGLRRFSYSVLLQAVTPLMLCSTGHVFLKDSCRSEQCLSSLPARSTHLKYRGVASFSVGWSMVLCFALLFGYDYPLFVRLLNQRYPSSNR